MVEGRACTTSCEPSAPGLILPAFGIISQVVATLSRKSAISAGARAGIQRAKVVNVANWSDGNPTKLEPHEPEPTDVVVTLGSKH
jgi:hypothetical protein